MFIDTTKVFLIKALTSNIQVITDSRLPALSSVKVIANDIIEIHSTNLQNSVKARVLEGSIHEKGAVCVPGKAFYDIIKALPGELVDLQLVNGRLVITSGGARFGIAVGDPMDFPNVPEFPETSALINREAFFNAISKTLFCASKDEARYNLNSVIFTPEEAAATDGHRLSVVSGRFLPITEPALVAKETLAFITKIFKEGDLNFSRVGSVLHFGNDHITYSANLISQNFPDYKNVLPTGPTASIRVSRSGFENIVERASLVNDDSVDLTFEDNKVTASSTAELGEFKESLPSTVVNMSAPITIRVRPCYLIEALKTDVGDTVLFDLRGATIPLIVRGDNHVQAIMPLRR